MSCLQKIQTSLWNECFRHSLLWMQTTNLENNLCYQSFFTDTSFHCLSAIDILPWTNFYCIYRISAISIPQKQLYTTHQNIFHCTNSICAIATMHFHQKKPIFLKPKNSFLDEFIHSCICIHAVLQIFGIKIFWKQSVKLCWLVPFISLILWTY